ncbi:MAG: hypothetical protein ACMXX7_00620 [Candidatus Woesearchaeota archaeon]
MKKVPKILNFYRFVVIVLSIPSLLFLFGIFFIGLASFSQNSFFESIQLFFLSLFLLSFPLIYIWKAIVLDNLSKKLFYFFLGFDVFVLLVFFTGLILSPVKVGFWLFSMYPLFSVLGLIIFNLSYVKKFYFRK